MRRETTLVSQTSPDEIVDPNRAPRNLVLCFDGTGNQYKGDGTETNILKIFGFLNRDAAHQCTLPGSIPIVPRPTPHSINVLTGRIQQT